MIGDVGHVEVEMRLRQVVRHYLRTWFAPDFLCVATDLLNFTSAVLLSEPRTGASDAMTSHTQRDSNPAMKQLEFLLRSLARANAVEEWTRTV
eukprot:3668340-Amphidinium_carterae.1